MASKRSWLLILALLIFVAGFLACVDQANTSAAGLEARTDKQTYMQGEEVEIHVVNHCSHSIFSHIRSATPIFCIDHVEKRTAEGDWQTWFAQCQPPRCRYDIDLPGEIKAGESDSLRWKPLLFTRESTDSLPAGPGLYRVAILYRDSENTGWKTCHTNDFMIDKGGR